ncbi:MAG: biopolymer transporter ExbD [Candidatus Marinimicrobia bacterium]|nr:biopolymer transporter ExbD [Candidatus Neomarinimicrobiota bacterium]MBL7108991.1 biopolymer transporter ExbD [Candidatus Neomarinimicrobiota bacterium]
MKIARKTRTHTQVSTASMPDIVFMLLIFFMVTTVMREFDGLKVIIPRAKMIEKLESKRNTSHIWATKDGRISVDDRLIHINDLRHVMYQKISANPKITVSGKFDKNATMELITEIHEELRKANALKLSYSALTEVP